MEIIGKALLEKLKRKNKGNKLLIQAIDELLLEISSKNWKSKSDILNDRPDADNVHNEGFYFFDIYVHRTMILFEFEDEGEATIVWCGSHDEYVSIFKNNKPTIRKWLKSKGLIN